MNDTDTSQTCIVCFEETTNVTMCCQAPICKDCYLEWLKHKRQCMHCKEDQCDFDTWVNEYRVEPDFDPHEYLHQLLQEGGLDHPMFVQDAGFGLQALLNVIQQAAGNPSEDVHMEFPAQLPPSTEAFEMQFGYTVTPLDQQGNLAGQGVTVTQHMDYQGGNQALYDQLQQTMVNYEQLFNQLTDSQGSPPEPEPDPSVPTLEMWPWNSPSQAPTWPPNLGNGGCNQQ
ncbi:hypothetical protein LCGC14_1586320 [marine sediment metagenome]|uniref:RING-type domain-containing protein n=2 Tax=root TaxID=1 RepID=A0A0F9J1F4_9ZZZZ